MLHLVQNLFPDNVNDWKGPEEVQGLRKKNVLPKFASYPLLHSPLAPQLLQSSLVPKFIVGHADTVLGHLASVEINRI